MLYSLCVIGVILFTGHAKAVNKVTDDKKGIILVTFGSSYTEPQKTFEAIETITRERYPNHTIEWGYTSEFIIKKLREGRGQGVMQGMKIIHHTPTEAMEHLIAKGYSTFALQSLHIIPGDEFNEIVREIEGVVEKYEAVEASLGRPLLDTQEDIETVAQALANIFADDIIEGPVCFMGHGTPHEADAKYDDLDAALKAINPHFFVGTVEGIGFEAGRLDIAAVVDAVEALNLTEKKVTITPLMSIAGDHANNDMNANTGATDPEEMSWREHFEAKGYEVTDVMKGLGDYDEINDIWMEHLEAVMFTISE